MDPRQRLDNRIIRCPGGGCWTFDQPHQDCLTDQQWTDWLVKHEQPRKRA